MLKTYRIRLILRPSGGVGPDAERELVVQARDEERARRLALEYVWEKGWIVGRFCSIEVLKTEKET